MVIDFFIGPLPLGLSLVGPPDRLAAAGPGDGEVPLTPSVSYLVTFSDAGGKYRPRYSRSHQLPLVRLVVRSVNLYW